MNTVINSSINAIHDIQMSLNKNIKNVENINTSNINIKNVNNDPKNEKSNIDRTNLDKNRNPIYYSESPKKINDPDQEEEMNEIDEEEMNFTDEEEINEYSEKNDNTELLIKNVYHLNSIQQSEEAECIKINELNTILEKHQNIFYKFIPEFHSCVKAAIKDKIGTHFSPNTISSAQKVIQEFQSLNKDLNFLYNKINYSINYYVMRINQIINSIININKSIQDNLYLKQSKDIDKSNDLQKFLQLRTNKINQLNKIIGTEEKIQDNNYILTINNKFNLIHNLHTNKLIVAEDEYYDNQFSIGYIEPKNEKIILIERLITTGVLGGLLKFRHDTLSHAKSKIGQLIVNFTYSFNDQNKSGYDINNRDGNNFFSKIVPDVKPNKNNQSDILLISAWNDSSIAKPEQYKLTFVNSNQWNIKKISDNKNIDYIKIDLNKNTSCIIFDGIKIKYPKDKLINNDQYIVKTQDDIINKLHVGATTSTKIGLYKNFFDTEDYSFNAQNIIALNDGILVEHKETLNDSYDNLKNQIQKKIAILSLNHKQKKSMTKVLKYHKVKKPNPINLDEIYKDTTDLHNSYMANTKVLKIENNIEDQIINIFN
ncbi:Flagellar hook-associated protein 1 [Buchnera aphidicola (Eriosoma grossulariae)]|uniref:FlgK family flagellar hook-associated protein n=1 Tax=Buchnera aphidicola TaxID=9 RepID=UPI0034642A79